MDVVDGVKAAIEGDWVVAGIALISVVSPIGIGRAADVIRGATRTADSASDVVAAGSRVADGRRAVEAPSGASTGCPLPRSFAADTEVLLADGSRRPIAQIEVGDEVLATDPKTGQTGSFPVVAVWPHMDTLLEFELSDGTVTTTEDHEFWNVTDQAWQESQHLDTGDVLHAPDSSIVTVEGLDWTTTRYQIAYDLTIAQVHTYYVHTGDDDVLVHNCGDIDRITAELDGHVDAAVARFNSEGLTRRQAAVAERLPFLAPAFRGERIDTFFRESVTRSQSSGALSEVTLGPRWMPLGGRSPDVSLNGGGHWWDVTTPGSWARHERRYGGLFGNGSTMLSTHRTVL